MNEEKINQTIGKNLSYYLEISGRSMSDLARYLNVSQTAVSNWCRGIKIPRMDKIDKICNYFYISRSDLMDDPIEAELPNDEFYIDKDGILHNETPKNEEKRLDDEKIEQMALVTAVLKNYTDEELLLALKLFDKFNNASPHIKGLIKNLLSEDLETKSKKGE